MAPLVAIELSKQHSRFPNESIVVIISPMLYSGYQLSITRDPQHKNDFKKPKNWCTSIISTSLPTVCKIYLRKSVKPCSSPLVKIIILLSVCTASSLHWHLTFLEICRVFQRPFTCMNDPDESSKSTRERTNYFCTYFSWRYRLNNITLQNYKVYKKLKSCSIRSSKTNTYRNNLVRV